MHARECSRRGPASIAADASCWTIAIVVSVDIAGAGRATRGYAQVEHQRPGQRFWIPLIA
jgi:hypothetical protein